MDKPLTATKKPKLDPGTRKGGKPLARVPPLMTHQERIDAFNRIGSQLAELFDAVFVAVNWTEAGETFELDLGLGNRYAVAGMLEEVHERVQCEAVGEDGWEDEGEDWKDGEGKGKPA